MNFIFEEDTKSNKSFFENIAIAGYQPIADSFVFAIQKNNNISLYGRLLNPLTESFFEIIKNNTEKENLYISVIENLLKQKEYMNLFYQTSQNLISEEEFDIELENNEERYLIKISEKIEFDKLKHIPNIVSKIKFPLSEEDLSEIFAINPNIVSYLLDHNQINRLEK